PIPVDTPLAAAGLDSVAAIELQHQLSFRYQVELSPWDLLTGATPRQLAVRLLDGPMAGRAPRTTPDLAAVADGTTPTPLSAMQQAILFEQELAPPGPAYVLTRALRIRGPLDTAALRRAAAAVIAQHPALHSRYGPAGSTVPPHPGTSADLTVLDLAGSDPRTILTGEANRPLPPGVGPPIRLTLLVCGADDHVLLLAAHHVAVDFWSLIVIIRDLTARYRAESGGGQAAPPAEAVTPADLARREAVLLASERAQHLWAYWSDRLAGAPTTLALPTDRARPARRAFRGAIHRLHVDPALTGQLRALAAHQRCTLFTVLLAAYQVTLARQAGQRDVVVGTLAAGRGHPSTTQTVGCLVNLVPVRAVIDDRLPFTDLLDTLGHNLRADLHHAAYPFAEIVRRLDPPRDTSRAPLVQALIVYQQEHGDRDEGLRALALNVGGELTTLNGGTGGALRFTVEPVPQPWTHVDLTLNIAELAGGLAGTIEYDDTLFTPDTIAGVGERLIDLLRHLTTAAHLPLGQIPYPTPADESAELAAGTGPGRRLPADAGLPELVEQAMRDRPDAVAVTLPTDATSAAADTTTHLSVGYLRRWAQRLAGHLHAAGTRPEEPVGVLLDRSPALPAALLAVLRAGAAYVPLDPRDPPDRLGWLVADAGIRVVITDRRARAATPDTVATVIDADTTRPALRPPGGRTQPGSLSAGTRRPPAAAHPRQAAYVIYTSGSTGRPKGVVVPHHGLLNRLLWMQDTFPLGPADRVVHKTPTSFDVSLWELWWPLLTGATLVLAPPGAHREPGQLTRLLRREEITIAHFVPSLLNPVLTALDSPLPALRHLVCSGEVLPAELRDRAQRRLTTQLSNLYGPTEVSIDATWWACRPGEPGPVPIGKPIANTRALVVDRALRPAARGVAGELALAGTGVARGYLGQPGRTADAFRPDPFAPEPGGRWYRTGDRARRRADGALDYLGRDDDQVKIGGVRIELAEIDAALRAITGVRDAASHVHDDGSGPLLYGYVVLADSPPDQELTPAQLDRAREELRRRLPPGWLPTRLVALPALPLTSSGKLNRGQLSRPAPAPATVPPLPAEGSGPLERRIAGIWARVLAGHGPEAGAELPHVGTDDGFYSLGGDSLTAVRLVAALDRAGIATSVAELVAGTTVRELAASAERTGLREPDPGPAADLPFALCPATLRAVLPDGAVDAYPLSYAQRAVLFHQMGGGGHEVYVTSLSIQAPFDRSALRAAVTACLDRHPYLRSTIDLTNGPEPMQVVHARMDPPLRVVDWRAETGAEQNRRLAHWLRAERRDPIDVRIGPLCRVTVHRLDDQKFQLSLSSFALDGWCTATVLTEILTDYVGIRAGRPSRLSDPVVSYRRFVHEERAALTAPEQRAFWAAELDGVRPGRLPYREPPADRPADGLTRRIIVPVDPEITQRLRRLARELGVSLKSVLLAAHLRVVRLLTAEPTVLTGLEVNGRPETPDGDRVVGVFNNIVPLRVPVTGSWRALARAAAAAEARIQPHRRYPFARLDRDHGAAGLFDTLFVYTHFHLYRDVTALDGVTLAGGDAPDRTYVPVTAHYHLDPAGRVLRLLLDYDPTRVGSWLAEEIAAYSAAAVRAIATDPDRSSLADPLLPPEALHRQLAAATGPAVGVPVPAPAMIRAQAARTPHAVAVSCGDRHLTYRTLVGAAEALAARLLAAGVRPDTVVAVDGRRDPELLITILGVWFAGAAYLPVPPGTTGQRRRDLVDATGATAYVTRGDELAWTLRMRIVSPTGPPGEPASNSGAVPIHAESLAYVLPTSGSTGRPNLVAVPHRALANYLSWCAHEYGAGIGSRTVAHSPVEFDLGVTSLFAPLAAGGTVVLLPDDADPAAVATTIVGEADGPLKITPAHFAAVGEHLRLTGQTPATQLAVVGGEALRRHHLRPWRTLLDPGDVINEYGPTETTVGCCVYRTGAGDERDPVPIGGPVAGARVHLLDDGLPVPDGVAAEIGVAGIGVARGYLDDAARTADRFRPDPFGSGDRVYRTGDRAWRDGDGLLHYLGRSDRQLKIRGHRLEPAEVEAILEAAPGVHQAAVILHRENDRGQLVAYWVAEPAAEGAAPAEAHLRPWLAERLPGYAVPDHLIQLPLLPLTVRGKIDHAALPPPGTARTELLAGERTADGHGRPRTDTERTLLGIFAEVLGQPDVGTRDDYFALGGDSITAIVLVAKAGAAGLELTTHDLLTLRTVDAIAGALADDPIQTDHEPVADSPPSASRTGAMPAPLPLTAMQLGMLYHSLADPTGTAYLVQATAHLAGQIDPPAFEAAWQSIVDRHPALRRHPQVSNGLAYQSQADRVPVPLEVHDLRRLTSDEQDRTVRRYLTEDRARPFDLARPPLLRLALLWLTDTTARFVFTHHHLLLDGWSQQVVLREFLDTYDEPERAIPSTPQTRLTPADEDNPEPAAYWRQRLAGFVPTRVPAIGEVGDPSENGPPGDGYDTTELALTSAEERGLAVVARQAGVTVPTILYAGWAVALSGLTGTRDVAFGVTVSGRTTIRPDPVLAVGMFINTLPLRVRLDPGAALPDWLRRVHRHQNELTHWERTPLTEVDRCLPGTGPSFDTLVVVENFPTSVTDGTASRRLLVTDLTNEVREGYPLVCEAQPGERLRIRIRSTRAAAPLGRATGDGLAAALRRIAAATAPNELTVADLAESVAKALRPSGPATARRQQITGSTQ
ncbi:hypothetical protein C1I95_23955, partial [Micromonospora craterilacus]